MSELATAKELELREAAIERGLNAAFRHYVEAGAELAAIRDGRLYRDGHETFEAYCGERWGFSRRQADRLILAAAVVEDLRPIGPAPANESQVRCLVGLPSERRREVWARAVETAPGGKVTARHVRETAEAMDAPPAEGLPQVDADLLSQLMAHVESEAENIIETGRAVNELRRMLGADRYAEWEAAEFPGEGHKLDRAARIADSGMTDPKRIFAMVWGN